MVMRPPDPVKLEQSQQLLRQRILEGMPDVRNLNTVDSLVALDYLEFRGRIFMVPPVPYRAGAAMQRINMRMQKLRGLPGQEERLAEKEQLCAEAAGLFRQVARPVGLRGRVQRWVPRLLVAVGLLLAFMAAWGLQQGQAWQGAALLALLGAAPLLGGLRWRSWWPNPFAEVSEVEVAQLLLFFFACQTRSRVKLVRQAPESSGT